MTRPVRVERGDTWCNAKSLAQWLGGAVGESVFVTPILALPGWLVNRTAPSPRVHVVNPKEIIEVGGCQGPSNNSH